MASNKVLVITGILEKIMIFLLQQNIINYPPFHHMHLFSRKKKKINKKSVYENAANLYNTLIVANRNDSIGYSEIADPKIKKDGCKIWSFWFVF